MVEYIILWALLKVSKRQKLWNLSLKFHFPEVKVISKELTRKMEIITLGSSLLIIALD